MSASTNATITVQADSATTVTVTPVANLIAPVAAGTVVANIQVAPAAWSGTLSQTNGSLGLGPSLIIAGTLYAGQLLAGSAGLAAGSYATTVTATP